MPVLSIYKLIFCSSRGFGTTYEKNRPKNIMFDKEALYDSTIHLKQFINTLKDENGKLKARVQQTEVFNLLFFIGRTGKEKQNGSRCDVAIRKSWRYA